MSFRRLVERADRLDTPRVRIAILLLFAALTAFVSSWHEPDRDEADYWLVSRDATLPELLGLMPYAGTPPASYLLQRPLARSGLPYGAQAVLHVGLATATAALLLEHAPFPLLVRTGLLLGPYLGVEYAAMRRSYGWTVLLLFGALSLLSSRRHPPRRGPLLGVTLAVMANTNAFGAGLTAAIAAGLVTRDLVERRRRPADWGLATLGILVALSQVVPPLDGQIVDTTLTRGPRNLVLAFGEAFFPGLPTGPAVAAAAAAFALVTLVSLAARPGALVTAAVGLLGPAALITFVYSSGRRHYGFLALGLLSGLWIGAGERDAFPGAVRRLRRLAVHVAGSLGIVAVGVGAWDGIRQRALEHDYPTSGAGEMARFIRAARLEDRVFIGDRSYVAEGVLPYLPRLRLWYPLFRRFGSYMPWNTLSVRRLSGSQMLARVERRFPRWRSKEDGVCLLLSRPLNRPERLGYRLAFRSPWQAPLVLHDEVLFLYVPVGEHPERVPRVSTTVLVLVPHGPRRVARDAP